MRSLASGVMCRSYWAAFQAAEWCLPPLTKEVDDSEKAPGHQVPGVSFSVLRGDSTSKESSSKGTSSAEKQVEVLCQVYRKCL